jgi:hypothetical protein
VSDGRVGDGQRCDEQGKPHDDLSVAAGRRPSSTSDLSSNGVATTRTGVDDDEDEERGDPAGIGTGVGQHPASSVPVETSIGDGRVLGQGSHRMPGTHAHGAASAPEASEQATLSLPLAPQLGGQLDVGCATQQPFELAQCPGLGGEQRRDVVPSGLDESIHRRHPLGQSHGQRLLGTYNPRGRADVEGTSGSDDLHEPLGAT